MKQLLELYQTLFPPTQIQKGKWRSGHETMQSGAGASVSIINQHTGCILYKESKQEGNGDKKEPDKLTQSMLKEFCAACED